MSYFDAKTVIPTLFSRVRLSPPHKITQLEGGKVNPIFNVDDSYIIRFNTRDRHIKKFERETIAYQFLFNIVPLPQLIAYNGPDQEVPFEWMILGKLPGQTLGSAWSDLSQEQRREQAFEAGKQLAQIHNQEIGPGFGRLENRQFESWHAYIADYANSNLALATSLGCLPANTAKAIQAALSSSNWLKAAQTLSLLHGDYWFQNIHYDAENGQINGIYDFEWAAAGDPAFDLKDIVHLETYHPGSRLPFEEGYRSIRPFHKDLEMRIGFYNMLYTLELIPVAYQHWGQNSYKEQLLTLNEQLAFLGYG